MAKQRHIDLMDDDNEIELGLEADFEHEMDGDLDVELDDATNGTMAQETAEPKPALTPEAALEFLMTLGRTQGYVS